MNAYAGPRMRTYFERFRARIADAGIEIEPYTIHSNGGLMSVPTARQFPVRTCLSGPAAGVVGASAVADVSGFPDIVTFDAGGTSTDVSLVRGAEPSFTSERRVAGYPVKTPMVDIQVIGAGGGSIAWIDDAGALKVGPRSAGADPGPVAYGKGGGEPTITDANVCLGRLNPVALLDGRMEVERDGARRAIEEKVARPLGLTLEQAAHGILTIANANMSRAIRTVSTERGHDISRFALFAYGGAGPLHAAEVAREVGIPTVVVPQEPGTMCARGILLSDVSLDFVQTAIVPGTGDGWTSICGAAAEMRAKGEAWLASENVGPAERSFRTFLDTRYEGQNFEVTVEVDAPQPGGLPAFIELFGAAHRRTYGYDIPGRRLEIVNARLQARGRVPKAPLTPVEGGGSRDGAVKEERPVYFGERHGWIETAIYARARLPVEVPITGPAVIEEMSSTTLVPPGGTARVDSLGNIVIGGAAR
jgi:N-methylhydantoinase A